MSSKTKMGGTSILTETQIKQVDSPSASFGPKFCGEWVKVLRVADMFPIDHPQVLAATTGLANALDVACNHYKAPHFSIQMTPKNIFLNGDLIRFDESQFSRSHFLRTFFASISVNVITCKVGLASGEIMMLLHALLKIKHNKTVGLSGFVQPNLTLENKKEEVSEEEIEMDEKRLVVEMYAGLVIKCSMYFQQISKVKAPSAKHIKRLIQKIASAFDEHAHIFIGLIQLRLIRDQPFVHAINTALYAMLIANEIGLGGVDIVRVGMTAITQDIHRMRNPMDEAEDIELGEVSHFKTNMTSVTILSEMGSRDVLSALRLVTSYERGFPFNEPLPADWYAQELAPHLLSRIIELANHYNMLSSGIGTEKLPADMALQTIMNNMGSYYDPDLTKLFINVVGVFPVGSVVLLSTDEQAIVTRSPSMAENKSVANRPTVRLLNGSERLLDLSAEVHRSIRIVEIVDDKDAVIQPSAVFLF